MGTAVEDDTDMAWSPWQARMTRSKGSSVQSLKVSMTLPSSVSGGFRLGGWVDAFLWETAQYDINILP